MTKTTMSNYAIMSDPLMGIESKNKPKGGWVEYIFG